MSSPSKIMPDAPDLDALDRRVAAMLAKQLRSRVWRDDEDGQLYVGLNDLFHAAADAEMIPPDEVADVVTRWETQGWFGILDWVIQRRYIAPALRGAVEERDNARAGRDGARQVNDELHAKVAALTEERNRLKEALETYGKHRSGCAFGEHEYTEYLGEPAQTVLLCTCGFKAALAGAARG